MHTAHILCMVSIILLPILPGASLLFDGRDPMTRFIPEMLSWFETLEISRPFLDLDLLLLLWDFPHDHGSMWMSIVLLENLAVIVLYERNGNRQNLVNVALGIKIPIDENERWLVSTTKPCPHYHAVPALWLELFQLQPCRLSVLPHGSTLLPQIRRNKTYPRKGSYFNAGKSIKQILCRS